MERAVVVVCVYYFVSLASLHNQSFLLLELHLFNILALIIVIWNCWADSSCVKQLKGYSFLHWVFMHEFSLTQ